MIKCTYIENIDSKWHKLEEEMPCRTTNVELKKLDNTIVCGQIYIDMSGWYIYLNPGWGNPKDYTHWRFK